MIERVTFVIPTFERPALLRRALDWYAAHGARVIVADGSPTAHPTAASVAGVTYLHQPGVSPHERIRNLVVAATTPYVVFCADDDLLMTDTVAEAVAVLDRDPACAAVQGRYVTFTCDTGRVAYRPAYLLSTEQDVTSSDVPTRMRLMFDPYHQWSYAIHRRETLLGIYADLVPRVGLVNANLIELLVALVTSINGKAVILPRLWAAREALPVSSGTVTPTLVDLLGDPSQGPALDAFLRAAIEHAMFAGCLDEVVARDAVNASLQGYLDRFLPALQRSYDLSEPEQLALARRLGGFPLFGRDAMLERIEASVVRDPYGNISHSAIVNAPVSR